MSTYSSNNDPQRSIWPNKLEYHFSLFSYVTGIISFWRFAYLAYDNDGAAFLYAFLFLYVCIGIPVLFLEMAWGQYGNIAPLQAFKTIPAMQGIGVCMLCISCACLAYFGVASYYFLLYLTSSFSNPLPWISCRNAWNTEYCMSDFDSVCIESEGNPTTQQSSLCNNNTAVGYISSSVEFWTHNLESSTSVCSNFSNMPAVFSGSTSSALVSPLVIFGCFAAGRLLMSVLALANHVRLTGKVAYLLSTVPFVVLCILLVRCVTMPGSAVGISSLFILRPSDLLKPKVWKDACGQVFLSIMASTGGLVTWSSYNRFYNKYYFDAVLLIFIVPILSVLSAVTVFGAVGHLSLVASVAVSDLRHLIPSPIVPIVAYSEAISQMWGDVMPWSIVVFSTFYLSSVSAALPSLECILSCLSDSFTIFRRLPLRDIALLIILLLSAAIYYGIPCFVEGAGLQIIEFFDAFSLPICLMFIGLVEMLLICYAFGFTLFSTNLKVMARSSCLTSRFWTFVWGGFTPLLILACLVFTVFGIVRDGVSSMGRYHHQGASSTWTDIAGGVLVGFIVLVFLLVAFIKLLQTSGSCTEKFHNIFTPHLTRLTGNGAGSVTHTNGELFMSDYTSHHEPGNEILVDDDIVTTV